MDTESSHQIKPTRDTLSILAEIEVAIEATEDSIETHKLLWVRDMLTASITINNISAQVRAVTILYSSEPRSSVDIHKVNTYIM